jgi:hypothetical protein
MKNLLKLLFVLLIGAFPLSSQSVQSSSGEAAERSALPHRSPEVPYSEAEF